MTQTWDCAEARPSLGVYVLGAIDPGERGLVDAHLVTCRDCRDELAGLAGLPALLARVNPDEISRIRADDTVRPASDDPPEELIGTVLGIGIVSLWTPYANAGIAARWFSFPNIVYLAPVPLITAGLIWYVWRSLNDRSEYAAFFASLGLFVMSYIGIAISLWPMIVPGHFTLDQAAASPSTQAFLLIGTLFLLPVILTYTAWSYWVFRGKVRSDIGYH